MKTTLDISDELLVRAKRYAKRAGKPLRAVVEESLQETLARAAQDNAYELPDCAVGTAGAEDPLERMSWQDLRDEIYGPAGR
jgi:hypothetical protein